MTRPGQVERKRRPRRSDRLLPADRGHRPRVYRIWPGAWSPLNSGWPHVLIEVRISRTVTQMRQDAVRLRMRDPGPGSGGMCGSWSRKLGNRAPTMFRPGRIATIFLCERLLLSDGADIMSHEATHAALVFMRWRGINPMDDLASEEALCYTVGELAKQLTNIWHTHAWRHPP